MCTILYSCPGNFYPRSPCGERPVWPGLLARPFFFISIHALLAESDIGPLIFSVQPRNFYPRSPCGERQLYDTYAKVLRVFLSTLSLRRATLVQIIISGYARISIHALLAESDSKINTRRSVQVISIHALLAESDCDGLIASANFCKFLSTLSLRRATS